MNFLGRGWSFPPTFDWDLAGIMMLEYEADVASSLEILLTTLRGERFILPEYGTYLQNLVFESLDSRSQSLIKDNIESSIIYHEPRIELEKISLYESEKDRGVILIEVNYRIRKTNSRFNFVFPYYKLEGTDIDIKIAIKRMEGDIS